MMTKEITRQAVDEVYKSLTAEDQEFIRMKYRDKKQMIAISMELNVSLSQLFERAKIARYGKNIGKNAGIYRQLRSAT